MKSKDKNKITQTANFIEELSWLLKSKKNLNLENVVRVLRNFDSYDMDSAKLSNVFDNKRIELVGTLPFLFQDKELFKRNLDIIEFAESLFNIKISRLGKKARNELIGIIVTEVTKIENDSNLNTIIDSLSSISTNTEKLKVLKKAKSEIDFSWNKTISNLHKINLKE